MMLMSLHKFNQEQDFFPSDNIFTQMAEQNSQPKAGRPLGSSAYQCCSSARSACSTWLILMITSWVEHTVHWPQEFRKKTTEANVALHFQIK